MYVKRKSAKNKPEVVLRGLVRGGVNSFTVAELTWFSRSSGLASRLLLLLASSKEPTDVEVAEVVVVL